MGPYTEAVRPRDRKEVFAARESGLLVEILAKFAKKEKLTADERIILENDQIMKQHQAKKEGVITKAKSDGTYESLKAKKRDGGCFTDREWRLYQLCFRYERKKITEARKSGKLMEMAVKKNDGKGFDEEEKKMVAMLEYHNMKLPSQFLKFNVWK